MIEQSCLFVLSEVKSFIFIYAPAPPYHAKVVHKAFPTLCQMKQKTEM